MGRYDEVNQLKRKPFYLVWSIPSLIVMIGVYLFFNNPPKIDDKTQPLTLPKMTSISKMDGFLEPMREPAQSLPLSRPEAARLQPKMVKPLALLAESDAQFKQTLLQASSEFLPYLEGEQLLKKIIRVLNDFSQAQRLYKHVQDFKLSESFVATQDDKGWFIADKSYQRYDALVSGFVGVENAQILEIYDFFKPLMQQVYAEFSYPEQYTLEDLIQKAMAEMLATPAIEGRVALKRPGVLYKFADNSLEQLSPVQKQVIRMGPENTRKLKRKLQSLLGEFVRLNRD